MRLAIPNGGRSMLWVRKAVPYIKPTPEEPSSDASLLTNGRKGTVLSATMNQADQVVQVAALSQNRGGQLKDRSSWFTHSLNSQVREAVPANAGFGPLRLHTGQCFAEPLQGRSRLRCVLLPRGQHHAPVGGREHARVRLGIGIWFFRPHGFIKPNCSARRTLN